MLNTKYRKTSLLLCIVPTNYRQIEMLKRTFDYKSTRVRIAVLLLMCCDDINGGAKFKGKKLFCLFMYLFCFIQLSQ